jgi:hypothetical protein
MKVQHPCVEEGSRRKVLAANMLTCRSEVLTVFQCHWLDGKFGSKEANSGFT